MTRELNRKMLACCFVALAAFCWGCEDQTTFVDSELISEVDKGEDNSMSNETLAASLSTEEEPEAFVIAQEPEPEPKYTDCGCDYFSGNVGIGTTSPGANLEIMGGAGTTKFLLNRSSGSSSGSWLHTISHLGTSTYGSLFLVPSVATADFIVRDSSSNNVLYIDTSAGNVGIGTATPDNELDVNGTIRAKEVIVETGWSDYVFEDDYDLMSLVTVEKYIEENGHLPGIPSADQVHKNGVSLGDSQTLLLAKIEELTLHLIEQNKMLSEQGKTIVQLQKQMGNTH